MAKIENVIKPIVEDQLLKFPIQMQVYLAKHIQNSGSVGGETSSAPVFNTGNKLYSVSGTLWKSFVRKNQAGNVTKITASGNSIELQWGTNVTYAAIHEYGGFITGTKKMQGFFWWRHKQTKAPFWKWLALAVKYNGGIKMKARPYMKPAFDEWKSSGLPAFKQQIAKAIIDKLNSTDILGN